MPRRARHRRQERPNTRNPLTAGFGTPGPGSRLLWLDSWPSARPPTAEELEAEFAQLQDCVEHDQVDVDDVCPWCRAEARASARAWLDRATLSESQT